jgi:hypothetical protein
MNALPPHMEPDGACKETARDVSVLSGQCHSFERSGRNSRTLECPAAAPAPDRNCLLSCFSFQYFGQFEERSVKDGAVIAGEFNQTGFLDQTAKFDQMSGTFAALHDLCSRIVAHTLRLKPMTQHRRPSKCFPSCLDLCPQAATSSPERTRRRACASAPSAQCRCFQPLPAIHRTASPCRVHRLRPPQTICQADAICFP